MTAVSTAAASRSEGEKRSRMARVMAHRGASADLPEQTLAAFRRAVVVGADGIECDVHLTADGQVVCLHDRTVDRTSTGTGQVADLTLAELRALDWGAWREYDDALLPGPRDEAHRVVTLAELVELMLDAGRPLDLAIETKHPSPFGHDLERGVLDVLDEIGARRGLGELSIRVITFSASAVGYLSEAAPTLTVEYLAESWDDDLLAGVLPPGASAFGPHIAMLTDRPDIVRRHQEAGYEIHPWTVDDAQDARFAAAFGCEIVTTNRPVEIGRALT